MYIPRALADLSATDSGINSPEDKLKWIVVAIVGSVLFIVATGVYLFITRSKARKYQAAQQKDPNLSRKEYTRVRKLSKAERVEEQETQRTIIIRKSLATKSPSASMCSLASRSSTIQSSDEEEEIDLNDNEPRGMKQDWKEFEARVKRDRTSSGEVHPISREPSPAPSWTVSSANQLQPHPSSNIKLQHSPSLAPQYSNPALAGHPAFRSENLTPHTLAGLRPAYIAKC